MMINATENIFDGMRRNGIHEQRRKQRLAWCPGCGEPGPHPTGDTAWAPAEIQINGWRISGYRRSIRDTACARCSLLKRWLGFRWCGRPYPLQLKRGPKDGCGCLLWAKTRMKRQRCPYGRWSI